MTADDIPVVTWQGSVHETLIAMLDAGQGRGGKGKDDATEGKAVSEDNAGKR